MTTRRRLAVAAFLAGFQVAMCLLAGIGTSGTALASTKAVGQAPHGHFLTLLAGSPKYVVYARFAANGHRATTRGGLFAVTRHGHPRRLGTAYPYIGDVSLAGPMVVYVHGDHGHALKWWNLASGAHGSADDTTQTPLSATPTGWAYVARGADGNDALFERTTAGEVTDLSSRYVEGVAAVTAHHLFVYGQRNAVAAMNFGDPGVFTRVIGPDYMANHYQGGGVISCPSADATTLACLARPEQGKAAFVETSFSLDGGNSARTRKRATDTPAALGTSVAWVGRASAGCATGSTRCHGRLNVLSRNGSVRRSSRSFDAASIVSAFGGVVLRTPSHRALVLVRRLTAGPVTLVTAG